MHTGFVEHAEDAFGCGALGPFVVLVWRRAPTPERMQRCYDAFERAAHRVAEPVGMIAVIEAGTPPPPLSMLPSIAREFDRQAHIQASVGVLEDRGLVASATAEVLSMLSAQWRRRQPTKVCVDAREGITWLAKRLDVEADPAALLALIEQVRAALPPRA